MKRALQDKKIVRGFTIDSGFVDIGDKKTYLDEYKKIRKEAEEKYEHLYWHSTILESLIQNSII